MKLNNIAAKAKTLIAGNREKIDSGLAKAGELADKKTKGKHHDKIGGGLGKVDEALDKFVGPGKDQPNPPPPQRP